MKAEWLPYDALPFPDTGCPVLDVYICYVAWND